MNYSTTNIDLIYVKTVPRKVIHHNGGSMRKRRVRHYFQRVDKEITVRHVKLKNAHPFNVEEVKQPNRNHIVEYAFTFDASRKA